jgi:hypothetical protein
VLALGKTGDDLVGMHARPQRHLSDHAPARAHASGEVAGGV